MFQWLQRILLMLNSLSAGPENWCTWDQNVVITPLLHFADSGFSQLQLINDNYDKKDKKQNNCINRIALFRYAITYASSHVLTH